MRCRRRLVRSVRYTRPRDGVRHTQQARSECRIVERESGRSERRKRRLRPDDEVADRLVEGGRGNRRFDGDARQLGAKFVERAVEPKDRGRGDAAGVTQDTVLIVARDAIFHRDAKHVAGREGARGPEQPKLADVPRVVRPERERVVDGSGRSRRTAIVAKAGVRPPARRRNELGVTVAGDLLRADRTAVGAAVAAGDLADRVGPHLHVDGVDPRDAGCRLQWQEHQHERRTDYLTPTPDPLLLHERLRDRGKRANAPGYHRSRHPLARSIWPATRFCSVFTAPESWCRSSSSPATR